MSAERLNRVLDYIAGVRIEKCAPEVQLQAKKCFLDLAMVLARGTRNESAERAAAYAHAVYPGSEATVLRDGKRASLLGATMANAVAANALDMDDGYSLTKGHPGAGIIAGILAAAESGAFSYGDVLSALVAGYELSMRQGLCLQQYYNFYHSTGSYCGFGTAAAVGKLLGLSREEQGNALGIADYFGPLTPCMRTVREPSLNKDGIYYGSKLGMEAVMLARAGFDGKAQLLADDIGEPYVATLGEKHYIMDLYFKFFSCCRWGQAALTAIQRLQGERGMDADEIEEIVVYSYGASGELYGGMPLNETEAQYNMKYPIASLLVHGEFGPEQSSARIDRGARVRGLMERIRFEVEPAYEKQFPAKRLTRVRLRLRGGREVVTEATEALGERSDRVRIEEIEDKGIRINREYCSEEKIRAAIERIETTKHSEEFKPVWEAICEIARIG